MTTEELNRRFDWHPPTPTQVDQYAILRQAIKAYAAILDLMLPDSREKSTALTNLETAGFWANAAIARHEPTKQ